MGTLLQDGGQLGRHRSLATLERDSQGFRRRAAQCRELADTCLTDDARQVLLGLAGDLDREAYQLEETGARPIIGGGRR